MKHLTTLFLLLLSLALGAKNVSIPASDSKILTTGRHEICSDGSIRFDWSAVTLRIRFTGSSLKMSCSDTKANWFNVWVDKEPAALEDSRFCMADETEIVLAKGLPEGEHTVILQKRTEGHVGTVTIRKFKTNGEFLQATTPRTRRIEFIGDSYTCGYGTEAPDRSEPFKAETENCNLTYAAICGRFFGAEVQTVCHSGRGLVRNYGDGPGTNMTDRYVQTFDEADASVMWDFNRFTPDIVVIYLGTNDFSKNAHPTIEAWCNQTRRLIGIIREKYGEVPVLMVASKASDLLGDFVEQGVKTCGFKKVYWTSIQDMAHNSTSELGASWHPNYKGQRKVASCMIPYISTITGWEMPFKAIE